MNWFMVNCFQLFPRLTDDKGPNRQRVWIHKTRIATKMLPNTTCPYSNSLSLSRFDEVKQRRRGPAYFHKINNNFVLAAEDQLLKALTALLGRNLQLGWKF